MQPGDATSKRLEVGSNEGAARSHIGLSRVIDHLQSPLGIFDTSSPAAHGPAPRPPVLEIVAGCAVEFLLRPSAPVLLVSPPFGPGRRPAIRIGKAEGH